MVECDEDSEDEGKGIEPIYFKIRHIGDANKLEVDLFRALHMTEEEGGMYNFRS